MDVIIQSDYFHIFLRLFLAGLFGGLVGFEREVNNHPAGLRTNVLVSLGSALIMLISIYGFDSLSPDNKQFDPQRMPAQVISGIGFLGAGTILRHGFTVTGLTTAASLWVVSGIGLAVGAGFYFGATITTFFVLISLMILAKLDQQVIKKRQLAQIVVHVIDQPGKLAEIASKIGERKINIKGISIHEADNGEEDQKSVSITLHIHLPKQTKLPLIIDDIKRIKGVKEVNFGKNNE